MSRLVRFTARSRLREGRTMLALTVAGVALGVGSVVSIQALNQSALAAFGGTVDALSGASDLVVRGSGGSFDEGIFPLVLGTRGVAGARPIVQVAALLDVSPDPVRVTLYGVDPFAPVPVRTARPDVFLLGGDRGDGGPPETSSLLSPGWCVPTRRLAEELGLAIGSRVDAIAGTRRVTLEVGAHADLARLSPLASPRMAFLDIAELQRLFGREGLLDGVDVIAAEGTDLDALIDRLETALGPRVRVLPPEGVRREAEGLLSAFRLNLTALSLISLFVGAFVVYSATLASFVRRRREIGVLRALGATRGQVRSVLLTESAFVGLAGVVLGVPLGWAAARLSVDRVGATISNMYLLERIERIEIAPFLVGIAALVGVGSALAGAFLPAMEASRRHPRMLLVRDELEREASRHTGRLAAIGLACAALAAVAVFTVGRGWKPAGFVLAIALVAMMTLVTPSVVKGAGRLARVRGYDVGLSLRNLTTRLSTTATAVAALAVAVSMLVGITIMVGSFRTTLDTWITSTIRADVYVSTASFRRGDEVATISATVESTLVSYPSVVAVDRLRQVSVRAGTHAFVLSGVDAALSEGQARFSLLSGSADAAFRAVREGGATLVSEPLARHLGLSPGDTLSAMGSRGPFAFRVAGVFHDYASEAGSAFVDLETFRGVFGDGRPQSLALYLVAGADPEAVVDAMGSALGADSPVRLRSNRRLREETLTIFDQTFAVTRLLRVMALLVALSGVALTLLVLARERAAELALHRALGARRRQVFRLFLGEGVSISALGIGVGAPGGVLFALILVFLVNRAYFGWTIRLHVPGADLAMELGAVLVTALLASIYPSVRASRPPGRELGREAA